VNQQEYPPIVQVDSFSHNIIMKYNSESAQEQLDRLEEDADIQQEAQRLADIKLGTSPNTLAIERNPFTLQKGTGGHRANATTLRLLDEIGGVEGIQNFTDAFYQLAFVDSHIDQFLRDHDDPHGARFASWIAEKFGDPTEPWTSERQSRQVFPFHSHGHRLETPHDRSSAHFAAWHSPKRSADDFGEHFKLDDARVWMRLHFAALRQVGGFERSPAFCDYYTKFIGHFVSIYESTATKFARESARWSENPQNMKDYIAKGRRMSDVIDASYATALGSLPEHEAMDSSWPYPPT